MPTYRPPLVGISQSEALAEAANFATDEPILFTLAFYHSKIVDEDNNQVAIYVVNDFQPLVATLEADAPIDPGGTVTFQPIPMEIILPAENEQKNTGEVQISISNVSRVLMPHLEAATKTMEPILVMARIYLPSDRSAPHEMPPIQVTLKGATATTTSVIATAGFGDIANRRFPKVEYTLRDFPTLA